MAHSCKHGRPIGSSAANKMCLMQECDRVMVEAGQQIRTQAEDTEELAQWRIDHVTLRAFSNFWSDPSHSHLVDGELPALYFGRATDIVLLGEEPGAKHCAHIMTFLGISSKYMSDKGAGRTSIDCLSAPSRETAKAMAKIRTHDGLVQYLAKITPCSCLDDLKKEALASPKIGKCHSCGKENTKVTLFKCSTRCMIGEYCSKECQMADWKLHKPICNKLAKQKK